MKKPIIRWGILGLGWIAARFIRDFGKAEGCTITALGSRSLPKAEEFKQEMGLAGAKAYGSYEELCADPGIDAIYIATPHNLHEHNTLMALEAGKAVLCEKPLAVNAGQAGVMAAAARAKGLFLMEAMWTLFLPVMRQAVKLVRSGTIGRVERITADLNFDKVPDAQSRLFNPQLAGGSLLDLGVYPLSFIQYLFGDEPEAVEALACIGSTGVDEQVVSILRYPGARLAQAAASFRFQTANRARVEGTKGWIEIPDFFMATTATVAEAGKNPYVISAESSYHYQVLEVNDCLRRGAQESAILPLKHSLRVAETMDLIRQKIGLQYPFETGNNRHT